MLRTFTEADQASVHDVILNGMKERWGDAYDPAFNSDLDDITGNYVDCGADVVVAERDGTVMATGMLIPDADASGRIVRMAVAGSHRRRGLGRAVVHELVRRARVRSMVEVRVLTDTPWTSAVELYLSTGFVKVGDDGRDVHLVMRL
ncbi:MAG: GNAT family N-acetyltransferase [Acidimicrobiales bacterium]